LVTANKLRQFRINFSFLKKLFFLKIENFLDSSQSFTFFFSSDLSSRVVSDKIFNFFDVSNPGIYELLCKANNKRYIGEASNVLDRLAKHSRSLLANTHECPALQQDWTRYGMNQFEAHILFCSPEFEDQQTRLQKEREIISAYAPEQVYNQHPSVICVEKENYRVVCEIHGKVYESIAEASRSTGERETQIRSKLYNNFTGYLILEKVKFGYEPIIANGKKYDSINEAVAAGEAKTRYTVMRRLKNPNFKDWNYLSPDKVVEK
jgi:predicted GIY-YIG superfamily endonuclease